MVHRVFEASELQCTCTLEVGDSGLIRAPVTRISREEGWLDCKVNFRPEYRLEVVLQVGERRQIVPAIVVDSGPKGLRLRWHFIGSDLDEDALEQLLMSAAGIKAQRRQPRPSRDSTTPTKPVRIDGHIDVEATLRSRARMVDTRRLSNHHVRVLDMGSIMGLISEAVEDVLVEQGGIVGEAERERLIQETEQQFRERLREFQNEKQDLHAHAQRLEQQLVQAQQLLEEERKKVISTDQFTVSDAGMIALDARMSRILDRALSRGEVTEVAEQELRDMLSRLLDDEREKITEQAQRAQGDRIELLERKVSRLSRSLDGVTHERDDARRRAHELETKGVVVQGRNVYEPGLGDDDPHKGEKLALLRELVLDNQSLRDQLEARRKAGASPE